MAFKIDIRNQQKTPREKVVLIGTGKGTVYIEPQSTLQSLDIGQDWILKDARLNISVAPRQVVYLNITSVTAPAGYKFGVKLKFEGNSYEKILGYNQDGGLLLVTILHDGNVDAEIEEQHVWSFTPPPHISTFTLQVVNQLSGDVPIAYESTSAVLPGQPKRSINLGKGDLYTKHLEAKGWVLSEAEIQVTIASGHEIPLKITTLASQQKGYLSAIKITYGQETQILNYNGEATPIYLKIMADGSIEVTATQSQQTVSLNCPPHPSTFTINIFNEQEDRPEIGYIPYRVAGGAMSTSILSGNSFFKQFPEAILWPLNRAELAISVATRQLAYLSIEAVSGEETGKNKKSGLRIEYGNQVKYLAYNVPDSLLTLQVKTNGEVIARIADQCLLLGSPPHPSNFMLEVNNELGSGLPIESGNKTIQGHTFTEKIFSSREAANALGNADYSSEILENGDTQVVAAGKSTTESLQNASLASSQLAIPLDGYTAHFRITSVSGLTTGASTTAGIRLEYGGWSEYLGFNNERSRLKVTVESDGTIWAEIDGKGVEFRPANQTPELLRVPEDFRTIQAAIDEAHEGSVILLAPGIYQENLDFTDKNVLVASLAYLTGQSKYIQQTILKPADSIVFSQNDHRNAGLYGLTLTQTNDDLVITYRDSVPSFQNCVFILENVGRAALVARNNSVPLFRNCTVVGGNYAFVISSGANVMIDNSIIQSQYLVRTHNVQEMHRVMAVYSTLFLENDRNNRQFINYNSVGFKTNSSSKPIFVDASNHNYRLKDTSSAKRTGRDKSEVGAYNILPTMKFQEIFRDIHQALKNPLFVYDQDQLWIQWKPSKFVRNYEISIKDLNYQPGQSSATDNDDLSEALAGQLPFIQQSVEDNHECSFQQTLASGNVYEVTITPQMSEEIMPLAKTFHVHLEAAPELSPSLVYFAQNNQIKVYWEKPMTPTGNLILLLKKGEQLLALERDLIGSDFTWSEDISKEALYEALFLSQQSMPETSTYDEGNIVDITISPAVKTSVTPLDIPVPTLTLSYENNHISAQWNQVGENFTYDFRCWEKDHQNHVVYTTRTHLNNLQIQEEPVNIPLQNGVYQFNASNRIWKFPLRHEKINRGKEYLAQVRVIDKTQGYIGAWSEAKNVFTLISNDLTIPTPQAQYKDDHIELRWQATRHAQGYDIDVIDAETQELIYQKKRFIQTFLFIQEGIEKGKNYQIKVRSSALDIAGEWCAPLAVFTLNESDLKAPMPDLRYEEGSIQANWLAIEYAENYEVVVKRDSESQDTISHAIVSNPRLSLSSGIDKYQTYTVKVRGVAADTKGKWSSERRIVAIDESDLTPPEGIEVHYENESIEAKWEPNAYAEKYEILVKANGEETGASLTVASNEVKKNTGIEKGIVYTLQVRSLASQKTGEWSQPQEIFTLQAQDLEIPQITLTNPNGNIEVSWEEIEFAETYEVSIKDGTNGEAVVENQQVNTNTCTFKENIEENQIYEVQVRPLAQGIQGKWSASRTIKAKDLEDALAIIKQRLTEQKERKGYYLLNEYTLTDPQVYQALKNAFGREEIVLYTDKELKEQGQQILIAGTTSSLFNINDLSIQLILMNQGNKVQTTINFRAPKDWKFTDSFPVLTGSYFERLNLQEAQFTFSSISYIEASWQVPITPGLNFYAKTTLDETLEVIQHLNSNRNPVVALSGKITIENSLPDIQLQFVNSQFNITHQDHSLDVEALLQTVLPKQQDTTSKEKPAITQVAGEIYLQAKADFLADITLEAHLTNPQASTVDFVYTVDEDSTQVMITEGSNDTVSENDLSSEDLRERDKVDGEERTRGAVTEIAESNLDNRDGIAEISPDTGFDISEVVASLNTPEKTEEEIEIEVEAAPQVSNLPQIVNHLFQRWIDWEQQKSQLLPEKYKQETNGITTLKQITLQAILPTQSIIAIDVKMELSNWAALAPYYSINQPDWVLSVQYPFDEFNTRVISQIQGHVSLSGIAVPFVAQAPDFELISDWETQHNIEASDLILDYSETSDVPLPGSLPNFEITRLELRIVPLSGEFYVTAHSKTPWNVDVTTDKTLALQNIGLTINRVTKGDDLKVIMHFFGFIKTEDTNIRLVANRQEGNWKFKADRGFAHKLPSLRQLISHFDDEWKNEMPQSLASLSKELLIKELQISLGSEASFNLLIGSQPDWSINEFLPTVVPFGVKNLEVGISKTGEEATTGHLSGEFDLGKKIFFPLIFALPFDEKNYLFSLVHFNEDISTPQLSDLLAIANAGWEDKLPAQLQNFDSDTALEIQNFQLLYLEDNGEIPEKTFIMEVGSTDAWDGWQLHENTALTIDRVGLRVFRTTNDLQSEFDLRLFGNLPLGKGAISLQFALPCTPEDYQITLDNVLEKPAINELIELVDPTLRNALPDEITELGANIQLKDLQYHHKDGEGVLKIVIANDENWEGWSLAKDPVALHLNEFELHLEITNAGCQATIVAPVSIFDEQATLQFKVAGEQENQSAAISITQNQNNKLGDILVRLFENVQVPDMLKNQDVCNFELEYNFDRQSLQLKGNTHHIPLEGIGTFKDTSFNAQLATGELPALCLQGTLYGYAYKTYYPFRFLLPDAQAGGVLLPFIGIVDDEHYPEEHSLSGIEAAQNLNKIEVDVAVIAFILKRPPYQKTAEETAKIIYTHTKYTDITSIQKGISAAYPEYKNVQLLIDLLVSLQSSEGETYFSMQDVMEAFLSDGAEVAPGQIAKMLKTYKDDPIEVAGILKESLAKNAPGKERAFIANGVVNAMKEAEYELPTITAGLNMNFTDVPQDQQSDFYVQALKDSYEVAPMAKSVYQLSRHKLTCDSLASAMQKANYELIDIAEGVKYAFETSVLEEHLPSKVVKALKTLKKDFITISTVLPRIFEDFEAENLASALKMNYFNAQDAALAIKYLWATIETKDLVDALKNARYSLSAILLSLLDLKDVAAKLQQAESSHRDIADALRTVGVNANKASLALIEYFPEISTSQELINILQQGGYTTQQAQGAVVLLGKLGKIHEEDEHID